MRWCIPIARRGTPLQRPLTAADHAAGVDGHVGVELGDGDVMEGVVAAEHDGDVHGDTGHREIQCEQVDRCRIPP